MALVESSYTLRVGILGCANIAKKNAMAIANESSCCVTAVASRSIEKAEDFIKFLTPLQKDGSVTCFGGDSGYDDLINSSVVDALYIPLPTVFHKEYVIKALKAGKHVLLEKPVALSVVEYEEMIAVAKENKKYLQDGTMFVHHPRTKHFIQTVQDSSVMGSLQRVEAGFSFCADENFLNTNIRTKINCDPLGCIGDLAWYVVRATLLAFGGGKVVPRMTSAQVVDFKLNEEGVPVDATCLVKFQDKILSFHCGFSAQFRQYIHVVGQKSWASMDDFVLPKNHPIEYRVNSMGLTDYDLMAEQSVRTETFDGPVQEVLMWKTFAKFANAINDNGWQGDSEECQEANALSQISASNQMILDCLMASIRDNGSTVKN